MTSGKHRPKRGTFTELELRRIPDKARITEDDNFRGIARATKKGISITWAFRYFSPVTKTQREISCGTWRAGGSVKMRDIRERRDRYRLDVANGIDPKLRNDTEKLEAMRRLEEEQQLALERDAERLKALEELKPVSELFLDHVADLRHKDGGEHILGTYNRYIKDAIGSVPVKELTDKQIIALLRNIVRSGKNRTAEKTYEYLAQAFAWAEKRQPWRRLLIEGNPVDLVEIGKILDSNYTGVRERVLSDKEITELDMIFYQVRREYDDALPGKKYEKVRPLDETVECATWLALATLARVGELTLAEWHHVDLNEREWFIPRENVKSIRGNIHKAHSIYLNDVALNALKRLKRITGHTGYLFPNKVGDAPRGEKEITRRISDNQTMFQKSEGKARRKQTNMLVLAGGASGKWTPHDLRRTGATLMEKLKIHRDVIDLCQNHVKKIRGSQRSYLHYKYNDEMKDAWIALGGYLLPLLPHAGKNRRD